MRYFRKTPSTASACDAPKTLSSKVSDLNGFVRSLPRNEISTARTVILTTYPVWVHRTFRRVRDASGDNSNNNIFGDKDFEGDDLDVDNEESNELGIEEGGNTIDPHLCRKRFGSTLNDIEIERSWSECQVDFHRVILDEAHSVKTRRTLRHQSIAKLNATHKVLITATPIINKPRDLHGLLSLFWQPSFSNQLSSDMQVDHYSRMDEPLKSSSCPDSNVLDQSVHILHPGSFLKWVSTTNESKQMDFNVAYAVLRPITRLIQIRRTMGEEIMVNNEVEKVDDAPPCSICTVELAKDSKMQKEHDKIYYPLAPSLPRSGESDEFGSAKIAFGVERRIKGLASNPYLDWYIDHATRVNDRLSFIHEKYGIGDRYLSWHFGNINRNPGGPPYTDRQKAATWQSALSPRMRFSAGLLHDICLVHRRNVVVFVQSPLVLWDLEMFLDNNQFEVLTIQSKHTIEERSKILKTFVEDSTEPRVLLTSMDLSATTLVIEKTCSDMVFYEVPNSIPKAVQAISRIHRPGQKRPQQVWILTTDGTYDQVLQSRLATKGISQLAAQLDPNDTHDVFEGVNIDEANNEHRVRNSDSENKHKYKLMEKECAELIPLFLGQRSQRQGWGDALNLKAKDELDEERQWIDSNYGRNTSMQREHAVVVRADQCLDGTVERKRKRETRDDDGRDGGVVMQAETTALPTSEDANESMHDGVGGRFPSNSREDVVGEATGASCVYFLDQQEEIC